MSVGMTMLADLPGLSRANLQARVVALTDEVAALKAKISELQQVVSAQRDEIARLNINASDLGYRQLTHTYGRIRFAPRFKPILISKKNIRHAASRSPGTGDVTDPKKAAQITRLWNFLLKFQRRLRCY